jgi:hypothetical protein
VDESISRFIEMHVRGAKCSVCSGTGWYIANDGRPMSFLSFAATASPRVDVYGVCCETCGYMRFHAADVVNEASREGGTGFANPS